MIALIAPKVLAIGRLSIHLRAGLHLIYRAWVAPHIVADGSELSVTTCYPLHAIDEILVPGFVVEEDDWVMKAFVELLFQRCERSDRAVEFGIPCQHEEGCILSWRVDLGYLAAGVKGCIGQTQWVGFSELVGMYERPDEQDERCETDCCQEISVARKY